MYAGKFEVEGDEGLQQGMPSFSAGFSFTIHPAVRRADEKLARLGGCGRFGMDEDT